jgi:hypothetical protein
LELGLRVGVLVGFFVVGAFVGLLVDGSAVGLAVLGVLVGLDVGGSVGVVGFLVVGGVG